MPTSTGVVSLRSPHSVTETVDRLRASIAAKGLTLFATIDHSGEAARAGLRMNDTKLLVFGSPKAGTPLMLAAPLAALDLPLKVLVAANDAGETVVSYNAPAFLAERHGLSTAQAAPLAGVEALVKSVLASS